MQLDSGNSGNWGIARLPHGGLSVPLLGLPGLRAEEGFVLESRPCAWCALVLLALPLHHTPPPWHCIPVEQCVNSGCTSGRCLAPSCPFRSYLSAWEGFLLDQLMFFSTRERGTASLRPRVSCGEAEGCGPGRCWCPG